MTRMRHTALPVLLAALVAASCQRPPSPQPRPLRVLMGADIQTLDPHASFDEVSSVLLVNLFESLVAFDRNFRLSPGLALRWINPDDRTWRFFLDPDARFPDGIPARASDVKFSIERLRSLAGSQLGGFVRHVTAVDVVDDLTVDIHTDTPVAILNGLAFIPIMSERHVAAAGDRVGDLPFGTGPYRLVSWEKGKSIVVEANEHRKRLPEVRRVEFVLRSPASLFEDVLALRPDITLYLSRGKIEELRKRKPPELEVVSADGLAVYYLTFNLRPRVAAFKGANPLRDRRVRQALSQATDRGEIVREALKDLGRPAAQLVVPQVFGFDPRIEALSHDPEAARRLLAEAGVRDLELEIETPEGVIHRVEELLIEQWARAGVRARYRERPADEHYRVMGGDGFMIGIEGYGCTSGDASEILTYCLHSSEPVRGYGAGNHAAYSHPEVDRITEENLRVFDPRRRLEMLQRALRIAAEDLPYLPLLAVRDVYVVSTAIRWKPPVNAELRLSEIGFKPLSGS